MGMTTPSARASRAGSAPTINVTPLIDVILVVLITFMLVAPLMTRTLWVNLPKVAETEPPPPNPAEEASPPLVLTVASDGRLALNRDPVTLEELNARLPRLLAAAKPPVLFFDAADTAPYGAAVKALDAARAAGARSLALLTQSLASR